MYMLGRRMYPHVALNYPKNANESFLLGGTICANPETPEFPVARRVNAALGFILAHSADRLWRDLGIHRFGFVLPSSSVLVGCEAVGERVRLINQLISRGGIDVHTPRLPAHDFS